MSGALESRSSLKGRSLRLPVKFSAAVVGLGMVLLAGVGLVAVASVSDVASKAQYHGNWLRILLTQIVYAVIGVILALLFTGHSLQMVD